MSVQHKNLVTPRERLRELRDGLEVSKDLFPGEALCLNCQYPWMQHQGMLCPSESTAMRQMRTVQMAFLNGELPRKAVEFVWRGTYFDPLTEGGDLMGAV